MKASDFNHLPEKMIKKLRPDERAIYRVNNVRPDPDNPGKFLMPSVITVRPVDSVLNKETGNFIDIAAIERVDIDGTPSFISIAFSASNMGYLFLNGNNPVHQKIYQYLELCNYNSSNPDRNSDTHEDIFHRVDAQKEAKVERSLRKLIVKAVNMALEMDDSKAKEVAMALGIDGESTEEIRNALEDYAEENPEEFMEVTERASLEYESLIKEAIKKGIINNNINSQTFEWAETKKEILKYKKSPGKNYIKELADYLQENNPDELNAIKTRLG